MGRFFHLLLLFAAISSTASAADNDLLSWTELPPVPDELGFVGPFVGVHNDAMILAGGANFPKPVWDNDKVWHDRIFVMIKQGDSYSWKEGGSLKRLGRRVTNHD